VKRDVDRACFGRPGLRDIHSDIHRLQDEAIPRVRSASIRSAASTCRAGMKWLYMFRVRLI